MRIGVDVRPAAQPERRGIGHYTVEVVSRMVEVADDAQFSALCLGGQPELLPPSLLEPSVKLVHRRVGKLAAHNVGARTLRRWDDRALGDVDVFFIPAAHLLAIDPRVPTVTMVHDTFFRTALGLMSLRERLWHRMVDSEGMFLRATRLVANSEVTRKRLLALHPHLEPRITVVPLGIDEQYTTDVPPSEIARVREKYGLPDRYVLFLGAIEPRKNVGALIRAYRRARASGLQEDLVIAGGLVAGGENELEPAAGCDEVHIIGYVDQTDKPALYAGSSLFAQPSIDEGFGLGPLEALAAGVPSLVSTAEAFDETVGAAALHVDARDETALSDGLVRLASDDGLRTKLLAGSDEVLSRFSWDACARSTLRLVQEAARTSPG